MWCVARFGISHYLAFVWSFEHIWMHANFFFFVHVVSICLYELVWRSNGSIKFPALEYQSNGLGASTHSNIMTFECCFLISKYHENCNAISSVTAIRHVPLHHGTLFFFCSAAQCFHWFLVFFVCCLLYLKKTKTLTYSCFRLGS